MRQQKKVSGSCVSGVCATGTHTCARPLSLGIGAHSPPRRWLAVPSPCKGQARAARGGKAALALRSTAPQGLLCQAARVPPCAVGFADFPRSLATAWAVRALRGANGGVFPPPPWGYGVTMPRGSVSTQGQAKALRALAFRSTVQRRANRPYGKLRHTACFIAS